VENQLSNDGKAPKRLQQLFDRANRPKRQPPLGYVASENANPKSPQAQAEKLQTDQQEEE
jgi:hypothetical protein